MLIKTPHLIFLTSLSLGTFIACSSSSWMMAWIGLEINLMSFTPILLNKLNSNNTEIAIKYFLIQAMASTIIILLSIIIEFFSTLNMMLNTNTLITLAICMKAGVAPLHFWFPQIMEYAKWFQALIILTWQKVAPLILISFSYNPSIFFIIMSSAFIGMLGGMNQTCLKKILTYSSIIHSAWLISLSFLNEFIWWIYFLSYCMLSASIIIPLMFINLTKISAISQMKFNKKNKMIVFINLLSLAGLPPFLGFFIKLLAINSMIYFNFNPFLIINLIMASLISFYFYSRMMYSSFLISEGETKIYFFPPEAMKIFSKMFTFSILGNIFISFLVCLS